MSIVFYAIYVAISHSHTLMYAAVLHTVEFQKRGLPHAHIILWVSADTSQPTSLYVDSFVSAEIPDPKEDPLGYALVVEQMVHGPCGRYNMSCPCMKTAGVPKDFQSLTKMKLWSMKMDLQCTEDARIICLLPKEARDRIIHGLCHIICPCSRGTKLTLM